MSLASEIRARLEAIVPPVFKLVAGAADFAALAGEPKTWPAAYVLIEEEVSAANGRATGPVLQQTEADVAVIIVTRNVSDNTGAAASDELDEVLKPAARGALVGFVPSLPGANPLEHISGNLLKTKAGTVWQRELFGASFYTSEGN